MSNLRALVADDEQSFLDLMARRLEKMGLTVERAASGSEALDMIENNPYDLIVSDIYMPGGTGLEILLKARARDPDVQVIVATASATVENAIEALNRGAFAFLHKPFEHISVFDRMVSRAIEYRQLILDKQRINELQKSKSEALAKKLAKQIQVLEQEKLELIELIEAIPQGVFLIEDTGDISLCSRNAENWLRIDAEQSDTPIEKFVDNLREVVGDVHEDVEINDAIVRLSAIELDPSGEKNRRAIIIQEMNNVPPVAGTEIIQIVSDLREGLGELYRSKLKKQDAELVKSLAHQVFELELHTGISQPSGEDEPAVPVEAPPKEPSIEDAFVDATDSDVFKTFKLEDSDDEAEVVPVLTEETSEEPLEILEESPLEKIPTDEPGIEPLAQEEPIVEAEESVSVEQPVPLPDTPPGKKPSGLLRKAKELLEKSSIDQDALPDKLPDATDQISGEPETEEPSEGEDDFLSQLTKMGKSTEITSDDEEDL